MKIAVLGGGITGLTTAYDLSKKKHDVVLFEKAETLGGLASGFTAKGWDWPLERAYHHLFANDTDIIDFAKEIGFKDIFFKEPHTDSLYETKQGIQSFRLDSPLNLLRFPLLSFLDKFRAGIVLAYLKASPFLLIYEKMSATEFLNKTMGSTAQEVLIGEPFRKKFGKYAGNILASFIWARVKKRTQKLGYISGGFQTFIEYLEDLVTKQGAIIRKGESIRPIIKKGKRYMVNGKLFDVVISTLPTPALSAVTAKIFPGRYLKQFSKLKYLWAQCLILESEKPLLKKTYWLSICVPSFPFMVLVQHTNLVNKKYYNDKHLLYIGNYLDDTSPLLKMTNKELLHHFAPYLKQLDTKYKILNTKYYRFQAPFAQPIFDKTFIENKPDFITPAKNFYIANLDMTYPYDRGTNYAVKLGREVTAIILSRLSSLRA